jgi:hypothetical protein
LFRAFSLSAPVPASRFQDEPLLPSRFLPLLYRVRREAGILSGLISETQADPAAPARQLSRRVFYFSATPQSIGFNRNQPR